MLHLDLKPCVDGEALEAGPSICFSTMLALFLSGHMNQCDRHVTLSSIRQRGSSILPRKGDSPERAHLDASPSGGSLSIASWRLPDRPHSICKAKLPMKVIDDLAKFRSRNKLKRAALHVIASMLPEDDIREMRKAFIQLDVDGDGCFTLAELKECLDKKIFDIPDTSRTHRRGSCPKRASLETPCRICS